MEDGQVTPGVNNKPQVYPLLGLVDPSDKELLCPINYVYDYLPHQTPWLKPQSVPLSEPSESSESCSKPVHCSTSGRNSIRLRPQSANLPLHTGFEGFRQSIYWKANEEATKELLALFSQDPRCSEVRLSNQKSMSRLAKEQLQGQVLDTYSRFSIYMFAEADKFRIQLLAQSVVLIFMFDDVWEGSSQQTVENLRENFVSRLRGNIINSASDTALERRIDAIRQGLLAGDKEEGNGGAEVLQTLIDFCNHEEPPCHSFSSAREYLDYRWEDIANSFTWACAKFTIRSGVNQKTRSLHRILRCLGDQISIVNDIASYDKEKRRFETNEAASMINLVHVIMKIDRLEEAAAKSMAYAWQLHTENEILEEVGKMKKQNELSIDELDFIDACMTATSGNLLTSIVISRYGGEDARIA